MGKPNDYHKTVYDRREIAALAGHCSGESQMRNPYRAIYEHFRLQRSMEWLTAEALRERYGGSPDYVRKVADHCLFDKLTAVSRKRPHGREYRPSRFTAINDRRVDRSEPKV
jgi:hypothetical protein